MCTHDAGWSIPYKLPRSLIWLANSADVDLKVFETTIITNNRRVVSPRQGISAARLRKAYIPAYSLSLELAPPGTANRHRLTNI